MKTTKLDSHLSTASDGLETTLRLLLLFGFLFLPGAGFADDWSLTGNAGTTASVNFIGTTDNQPLELKVNNARALRLEQVFSVNDNSINVIGGFGGNRVLNGAVGATICGGGSFRPMFGDLPNEIGADFGAIGGGTLNQILSGATHSTIAGGYGNKVQNGATYSTIAGGDQNTINAAYSAIGGGDVNTIYGFATHSTIGGGEGNLVWGYSTHSTIGGGYWNLASGFSTVPGGYRNTANGVCSFAAGHQAKAIHDGAFVWADNSSVDDFVSEHANQFAIRARGGVRLENQTSLYFGDQTRQMMNLWKTDYGIGVQAFTLYQRSHWRFSWYRDGAHAEAENDPGGGAVMMTLTPNGLTVNGTVVSSSDRNLKEQFEPVDALAILDEVASLPITRWSFTNDPPVRHIGPMAQDFYDAFGVGMDDKHIATVDEGGVALAAIQGLNQKLDETLKERDARIVALEKKAARLDELEKTLAELKTLLPQSINKAAGSR